MKTVIHNKPDKNIPIHTSLEKKKILIHDTNKVLFFEVDKTNVATLVVPTFSSEGEFRESATFMKPFIKEDMLQMVYQTVTYSKILRYISSKLKKVYEKVDRNYFSYYHEFTKEEEKLILEYALKEEINAYMLSFLEIQNLESNKNFRFDEDLVHACSELENEIKRYVKR